MLHLIQKIIGGKFAMLGKTAAALNLKGAYHVQHKLDGMRVIAACDLIAGSVRFFSRNGKEKQMPEMARAILEGFRDAPAQSFILDGEMMSADGFAGMQSQFNRKHSRNESGQSFHIFDVVIPSMEDARIEERHDWIASHAPCNERIKPILNLGTIDFNDADAAAQLHSYEARAAAEGYEGVMLKKARSVYECKRSSALLKRKPVASSTLSVIKVIEGDGKYIGMTGALECAGVDHSTGRAVKIKVSVGSGISDAERQTIWAERDDVIGRAVEVMSDGIADRCDDGDVRSLRFPRFGGFRYDVSA